jgi:hypothetical protein
MPNRRVISPIAPALACVALIVACAGLSACGGGSHSSSQSASKAASSSAAPSPPQPSAIQAAGNPQLAAPEPQNPALKEVIATVRGRAPITRGELLRYMEVGGAQREEGHEPASVLACIAQMRSSSVKLPSELSGVCREHFQKTMEPQLGGLIHGRWLEGEAGEQGITVNPTELEHELEKSIGPPHSAMVKHVLAQTGQTEAEVRANLELQQYSDRLYEVVERKVPKATGALLARYYEQHRQSYDIPPSRDLHIIRFASDAAARKGLGELRSGKSFSSVAKQVPIPQPIGTRNALLRGLARNGFSEPVLADAIFSAPLRTLQGPVKIFLGYYDFEVLATHPGRQQTLAQVRPALIKQLPELLHDQTLASFADAYRRKWISRSSCKAGWVVQNCRQYRVTKGSEAYDPYTL